MFKTYFSIFVGLLYMHSTRVVVLSECWMSCKPVSVDLVATSQVSADSNDKTFLGAVPMANLQISGVITCLWGTLLFIDNVLHMLLEMHHPQHGCSQLPSPVTVLDVAGTCKPSRDVSKVNPLAIASLVQHLLQRDGGPLLGFLPCWFWYVICIDAHSKSSMAHTHTICTIYHNTMYIYKYIYI